MTLLVLCAWLLFRDPCRLRELDTRHRTKRSEAVRVADKPQGEAGLLHTDPALAARIIWLRAVLCSIGICLVYAALERVPLSDFHAIFSTRAFIIGFICWIGLRESFGWRLKLASGTSITEEAEEVVASCIGVLLITKPSFLVSDEPTDKQARTQGYVFVAASLALDAAESELLSRFG